MHVEQVTDEHHPVRCPFVFEMLAEREIPRVRRWFVNVTDDQHPRHGVKISIVIVSDASQPKVPPSSISAVVRVIVAPEESLQYQRESPAPVGDPSTAYAGPPLDGVTVSLMRAVAGQLPGSLALNVRLSLRTCEPESSARYVPTFEDVEDQDPSSMLFHHPLLERQIH